MLRRYKGRSTTSTSRKETICKSLSRMFLLVVFSVVLANIFTKGKITNHTNANFITTIIGGKGEKEDPSDELMDGCGIENPITDSPIFSRVFEDDVREKFQIWDGCEPLQNPGIMCEWYPYRVNVPSWISQKKPKICLSSRTNQAFMNNIIKTTGRWTDCPTLINLYDMNSKNEQSLYVEIGTHFGPCIYDVLFSTNATVVAFENDATNLYQMTSTLLTLPEEIRRRVVLFYNIDFRLPLENSQGDDIDMDKGNDKNTFGLLQQFFSSLEATGEESKERNEIVKTTLGYLFSKDVLNTSLVPLDIAVLKIDAPGMGCDIVEGAKHVLQHTKAIVKVYEIDGQPAINDDEGKRQCTLAEWKKQISTLGSYDIQKLNAHLVALPVRG